MKRILTSQEIALLANMAEEMARQYAAIGLGLQNVALQCQFRNQSLMAGDLAELFQSEPQVEVSE